jgi:hypothetical protein
VAAVEGATQSKVMPRSVAIVEVLGMGGFSLIPFRMLAARNRTRPVEVAAPLTS